MPENILTSAGAVVLFLGANILRIVSLLGVDPTAHYQSPRSGYQSTGVLLLPFVDAATNGVGSFFNGLMMMVLVAMCAVWMLISVISAAFTVTGKRTSLIICLLAAASELFLAVSLTFSNSDVGSALNFTYLVLAGSVVGLLVWRLRAALTVH